MNDSGEEVSSDSVLTDAQISAGLEGLPQWLVGRSSRQTGSRAHCLLRSSRCDTFPDGAALAGRVADALRGTEDHLCLSVYDGRPWGVFYVTLRTRTSPDGAEDPPFCVTGRDVALASQVEALLPPEGAGRERGRRPVGVRPEELLGHGRLTEMLTGLPGWEAQYPPPRRRPHWPPEFIQRHVPCAGFAEGLSLLQRVTPLSAGAVGHLIADVNGACEPVRMTLMLRAVNEDDTIGQPIYGVTLPDIEVATAINAALNVVADAEVSRP